MSLKAAAETGISNYNPKTKTLSWNHKLGIVTTNGTKLSPASVLNHEADHTADAIKDPTGHVIRTNSARSLPSRCCHSIN